MWINLLINLKMKLISILWRIRNYLKFKMAGVEMPNDIKGFNVKNKFYLNIKKEVELKSVIISLFIAVIV